MPDKTTDDVLTKTEQFKKNKTMEKAKELKLTDKQRKFAEHYVVTHRSDIAKSVEYGGYQCHSLKSAQNVGYQLTVKDKVKSFIHYLEDTIHPSLPATATYQELLEYWSEVLRDGSKDENNRMKASDRLYSHLKDDKDNATLQGEYKDVSRMTDDELVDATAEMLKRLEALGLADKVAEKLQDTTD